MKKIFSNASRLVLAALLCTSTLAVGASAHKDFASWGDVPYTSDKIVMDGKLDEIYKQGLIVDVNIADGDHATAKAYLLWADDSIYCAFEVTDPELCPVDLSKNAWEIDGVELVYDWKNDGSTRHKWLIHHDGSALQAGDASLDAIEIKATETANSYIVETKTKLGDGVDVGSGIGINLLIDDMSGGNTKRTIVFSAQSGNATENEVAKYDYVVLSDKKVSTKKETPASAAQTADVTAVAALMTAVSGAALALKKRK